MQSSGPNRPHHLTNFEAIRVFYDRSTSFTQFSEFELSFLNYFALTRLLELQSETVEEAKRLLDKYSFTTEEKVQILNFFPQSVEEFMSLVPNCTKQVTQEDIQSIVNTLITLYTTDSSDDVTEVTG